ncbi:hypothetical protein Csp1_04120 [Corynebacterium provencense]|jgi:hypothetical protein|uniref:Uncharacterized protein n=1 Tax=Corynebacterium provencense TaxID=1737425 RepID=A0A2Z3YRS2_9CORY|nr:hypothetical protein Csp1_04120 [Corynebacterium provencense]
MFPALTQFFGDLTITIAPSFTSSVSFLNDLLTITVGA